MVKIQSDEIQLWLVEDQSVDDKDVLDSYHALLNNEELKRLERFVFPRHKKQFLLSRALLRSVLANFLELTPEELVFARNAYGKPRIASFAARAPLHFNLSHTNGLSVLAIAADNELGVDAEYLTRRVDILKLARRYFSAEEADSFQALDVSEYNERFFDLWTLKESYIKACGMGMAIPLKDFTFHFQPQGLEISFAEGREDSPEHWYFWQYRYREQFQLALALKDGSGNEAGGAGKKVKIYEGVPMQEFTECGLEISNRSATLKETA